MANKKTEHVRFTTQVTITLPKRVNERLKEECEKLGINRSAYMTMCLNEKWIREDEYKKRSANTPSSDA